MSKRFTKIICTAVAAISAISMAFLPACKSSWGGVSGDKDTSTTVSSNGGFLVETGADSDGYVYFINGTTSHTDPNSFGSVLKGSVQRLKKTEMAAGNYANTQTVVPSVVYSGSYNAGLCIYGGYVYYTTPSANRDSDGNVLNDTLEFKRTKLDGSYTSGALWSSTSMDVDYRFVEVDGTVYILYALSENLYGTTATNIHSVNCSTGKNTVLAYNTSSYSFDTEDATNPYVYYTMNVPSLNKSGATYPFTSYNQLFMVRADATESPREYDLSEVEGYNASSNPVYINYGKHVFDGIGRGNYNSWLTQFNFDWDNPKHEVNTPDRTFTIKWYKDGTLYYTRGTDDSNISFYSLTLGDIDSDNDGKVDDTWDAMTQSWADNALVSSNVTTEYTYVTLGDKLYAINATSSGVTRSLVEDKKIGDPVYVTNDSASTVLEVREETDLGHTYLYYSVTGGSGYTINRVAIDGDPDDYGKMPVDEDDLTYETVKVLDLDASSDWYKPEFVGNKLFFASEIGGMSEYNYVMVCDLGNADGKMMSNGEIEALNEKFQEVSNKIAEYDDEQNGDGSAAYDHLSSALKYLFYTGDVDYIDELIDAYVKIEGRDKEYVYSEASVKIYKEFAAAEGDWADYKSAENTKTINGKEVRANMCDYYYTVVGRMTDKDAAALKEHYKSEYMESYPVVEYKTWWTKLSTGGKVGAVFGIVEGCMLVIGGAVVLTAYLLIRKKSGTESGSGRALKVDLTDDRDMDVYGDESEPQ